MALSPGTRLGSYEIVALLGAGGMGEVYRARDARLGRDVAIKILPEVWLADPDRVARFDREASILASLNHPHIGAIYSVDAFAASARSCWSWSKGRRSSNASDSGAPNASALEQREALRIARQVADALEAAHEKGIIHRDLKPANIKITPDGIVKVLDFGLATYRARTRGVGCAI